MNSTKLKTLSSLSTFISRQKKIHKKIVFTNGCFDILHVGHVRYLQQAKALGDILVVGVNSDASVRGLKGEGRPVNSEKARAEVLSALACVDFLVIFSEETPKRLIEAIKPNFLVKGGDWKNKDIVGADFVESYGGKVKSIPFVEGYSTTRLIDKINETS